MGMGGTFRVLVVLRVVLQESKAETFLLIGLWEPQQQGQTPKSSVTTLVYVMLM